MIRPISTVNTAPNFRGFTYTSDENNYDSLDKNPKMSVDFRGGLITGLMVGASLVGVGSFVYKDSQIDNVLRDIAATKVYENADSFVIEDVIKDDIPEFVLVGKNGDRTVYDLTSGKIYFDEDGELIEKY